MDCKYQKFQEHFPSGTKILSIVGSDDNFEAVLRCRCKTKDGFQNWLQQYQNISKVTFRVAVTRPRTGRTVIYKASYRCQHNTYPNSHRVKKASDKHTNCPAVLRVTIKSSVENRRVRSKDELRAEFPTLVTIIHNHNHEILVAEALKYRDMSEEVKCKLIDLFKSNHPPGRALEVLKKDLIEEHGPDYFTISADSSVCPNYQAVYHLYDSMIKKEFEEEKFAV